MAGYNNSPLLISSAVAHPPPANYATASPLLNFIHSVILNKHDNEDPFYVLDCSSVASLMNRWIRSLPSVRPFYAVKCNPDPSLLAKLAQLGSGFDCASRAEIQAVLSLGVSPDRIIFANTCKSVTNIKYAAEVGVNLATFDSEFEISKIQKHHPNCELLIRIKVAEDEQAVFPLGKKFGALAEEVEPLLRSAQDAGIPVVGVSLHIGSGATRVDLFRSAIEAARKVFDEATRIGLPKMRLLNIGGGVTADKQMFEDAADMIKSSIAEYFGDAEPDLRVISEPGRFFAGPVFTLVVKIIGKRVRGEVREYWINDGIYGSIKFDDGKVKPTPFACTSNPGNVVGHAERVYPSTVYGPTCAGVDTVLKDYELPELEIDDWIIFPKMGAYTMAVASNFNGFSIDSILTYVFNN